jgi:hypothetical protein
MHSHWHIIWTIHGFGLPQSATASWPLLSELYAKLAANGLSPARVDPISERPIRPHPALELKALNVEQRASVRRDLLELGGAHGDRVSGHLGLRSVLVEATYVELLLEHEVEGLLQKLSRLKSRSATLLSFRGPHGTGGRGTWSKGFWTAEHLDLGAVDAIQRALDERVQKHSRQE